MVDEVNVVVSKVELANYEVDHAKEQSRRSLGIFELGQFHFSALSLQGCTSLQGKFRVLPHLFTYHSSG